MNSTVDLNASSSRGLPVNFTVTSGIAPISVWFHFQEQAKLNEASQDGNSKKQQLLQFPIHSGCLQ